MTDIGDEDLKSRADYVEVTVNSVEQCARYCSLGSACDTFFIDSALVCTYLPHVSLKSFELIDFVNYTKEEGKDMYLLQCSQGNVYRRVFHSFSSTFSHISDFERSFVENSDPFTQDLSNWQGIENL